MPSSYEPRRGERFFRRPAAHTSATTTTAFGRGYTLPPLTRLKEENALMRIHYAVMLAAAALLPTLAQTPKPNSAADWPMYNRDLAGTRYSPLTQISATNVANLKMAWSYRLSNAPAGRGAAPAPAPAPAQEQAGGAPAAEPAGGRGGGGRGAAAVPTVNPEATPIVINGIMYLPAGGRVLALEAET